MIARLVLVLFLSGAAIGGEVYVPCDQDVKKQALRSKELQDLVNEDQEARKNSSILAPGAVFRDRQLRMRVGEIFGEGCIHTAADYAAAALVYQHGDRPDHFYQAFLWSKRGVELGDETQKIMVAWTLDRYLINSGQKQLFGSQGIKIGDNPCWCLRAVEKSFPNSLRLKFLNKTLEQQFHSVEAQNKGAGCPKAKECEENLKPSPRGTVPGFW